MGWRDAGKPRGKESFVTTAWIFPNSVRRRNLAVATVLTAFAVLDIWLPGLSMGLTAILVVALGVLTPQLDLIGVYLTLAPGSYLVRLTVSACLATLLWLVLLLRTPLVDRESGVMIGPVFYATIAGASIFLLAQRQLLEQRLSWYGRDYRPRPVTMRQLFASMAALAIGLTSIRAALPDPEEASVGSLPPLVTAGLVLLVFAVAGAVFAAATHPILFWVLGRETPDSMLLKVVYGGVLPIMAAGCVSLGFMLPLSDGWGFLVGFICHLFVYGAVIGGLRLAGLSLVDYRPGRPVQTDAGDSSPNSEPSSPAGETP